MAEATAAAHCCRDAPGTDNRRVSDVCLGIHVKNHVEELTVMAPDVACDMPSRGLEGKPQNPRNYLWHMKHIKLTLLLPDLLVIYMLG